MSNMDFEIPAGLTDLLQDFTVSVLREKPSDLVQFAAGYFNTLAENKSRQASKTIKKGVSFGGSEDEAMQTDSDDEPMPGECLVASSGPRLGGAGPLPDLGGGGGGFQHGKKKISFASVVVGGGGGRGGSRICS